MSEFLSAFGLLFIIVVAIAFAVKLLRQPIIIGYVLSGFLFALFLAKDNSISVQIATFASLGITFLLFLMGLEFDLKGLKYLGKDLVISVLIQSVIYFMVGFGLSMFFDFSWMERIHLGIIFMVCSTLLVAKWVDDKKESNTLHGKLTLGTLIIQDIVAIIAITLLSVVRESSPLKMAMIPASIIALCLFGYILSKYVLNYMLRIASKYPELLFIFGLSICFIFVELALRLGISESIGAFIGGVVLANTIYKSEVSSRLKPLLTFFNMLFFVGLGFQLDFSMDHKLLIFTAIFTIITFIIKPAITYLTLRERKYDIKTAFLSGISLSPMSEFGIIVVASGISLGLVDPKLLPIAIISSIASMIIGSYVIKYDKQLWKLSEPYLRRFDKLFKEKEVVTPSHVIDANVVFFGYYEFGKDLYEKMAKMGKKIVVITHDPTEIEELKKDGVSCIYSSVSDPEFFEHHKFENLDLIISNIRDVDENKIILDTIKSEHHKVLAIVTAKNIKESVTLYDYGADYVIYPTYVNEQQISVLLEDYATDINKVIEKKMRDITKFKSMPQPKEEKLLNVDQLFEKMNPRSTTNFLFNMFKAKPPKTE